MTMPARLRAGACHRKMGSEPMTVTDTTIPQQFYHGTRADLKPGDLIEAGYSSNTASGRRGPGSI